MDQYIITQSEEIIIRRTRESDLEFVLSTEYADENKLCRGHVLSMKTGLLNPNSSVEFKRTVITQKDKGYGRKVLRLIKKWAFESLDVHRMWLAVKEFNHRARALYASEGFIVEGTLRECLKADDGSFESLVVMSLLKREYQAGTW
jgi:hypothetical protein